MANILRVPQQFAVNFAYNNVKHVMQTMGEEVIALKMYHVNDDEETQPRCGICYDDVYQNNNSATCAYCYGTTFQGGVKEVWRIWAVFSDQTEDVKKDKTGYWQNENHNLQMEGYPALQMDDYVIRVKAWDSFKQAPLELGKYYRLGAVRPISVRTGIRFGGTNWDRVGQKTEAFVLPKTEIIYQYDVKTEVTFPRYDGAQR